MMNNKHQGNVNILVIVIMSMVLFFGLYLYQRIDDSKNLSNISYNWFEEKNQLNNDTIQGLYLVENALYEAEEKAFNYIYNEDYLKAESSTMPLIIHQLIQNEFFANENSLKAYDDMMKNLYYFYANARLESLVNDIPTLKVYKLTEGGIVKSLSVNMVFYSDTVGSSMDVELDIKKPSYEIYTDENGRIILEKDDTDKKEKLYTIKTYRLNRKVND